MAEAVTTQCCIAGGGPAGMMLGFLLARAGIDVAVLEKHKDFFRDFRGDTIHPSTLELMHELGLLDEFLKVPHQAVSRMTFQVGAERIPMVGPMLVHALRTSAPSTAVSNGPAKVMLAAPVMAVSIVLASCRRASELATAAPSVAKAACGCTLNRGNG